MGIIGVLCAFLFIYWLVRDDKRRRLQRELDLQRRQEQRAEREQQAQVQAAATPPSEPRAPATPPVVSTGANIPSMNEPEQPRSTYEPSQPQPKGLEYVPELVGSSLASGCMLIVGVLGGLFVAGFVGAMFDDIVSSPSLPIIIGIIIIGIIIIGIIIIGIIVIAAIVIAAIVHAAIVHAAIADNANKRKRS
jgi:hypothetical protein